MVEDCNNYSEENKTLGTCNMPCIISSNKHSKCHSMHEIWISYQASNYTEHSNYRSTTEELTMEGVSIFSQPICLGTLSFHNLALSFC